MQLINLLFIQRVYAADQLMAVTKDVSITELFTRIMSYFVLPVISAICVGAIIYGGIMFMTSAGDPEKVKKARSSLLYAIIGIVIIVVSSAFIVLLNSQVLKILN